MRQAWMNDAPLYNHMPKDFNQSSSHAQKSMRHPLYI
uniref:Uncharacterized protein n=1 Tax=mine drainage metagenome TaxID=410659 RepID=E6Q052_9ZZZZ